VAPNHTVWLDGQQVSPGEARVSIFDRGFLYGDSVFEVMRTYGGKIFALGMHLARLERSAGRVGISLPISLEMLAQEVEAALDASASPEAKIRVVVTRGEGPLSLDPTTAGVPTRVAIVSPLAAPPPSLYEQGVSVALVAGGALPGSPAAGAKASNYLANLLAAHEARGRGAYEAFLVGPAGELREGATSNVFLVRHGQLVTPRPEAGILEGVTRAAVFEAARRLGIDVQEDVLFASDVYGADECFLTSSLREIVPVVRTDGLTLGAGRPGKLTRRLHAEFRELARAGAFGESLP
jgi:branched-chain amino acid aminotransferase